MPPKPKRSTAASAGPTKRPKTILEALLSTDEQVLNSLKAQHKGKRLLLKADALYGKSRVPRGEENYNFLYIVQDINPGGKEAVIEYEGKYIKDGDTEFKSYPPTDDSDYKIENYRIALIREDANLYNCFLGVVNKRLNDERELKIKLEAESKKSASDDVSDIERKIHEEGLSPYDVLVMEFEPAGPKVEHVVTKGTDNVGAVTEKQDWSKFVDILLGTFCSHYQSNLILMSFLQSTNIWNFPALSGMSK